jgi:hypothetical protein
MVCILFDRQVKILLGEDNVTTVTSARCTLAQLYSRREKGQHECKSHNETFMFNQMRALGLNIIEPIASPSVIF